ncbi:hypothetical protein JR316_0008953 [Psilocybe cubensis]|uniref:DASH complex subunit DAM1 n=2 Tax=Psilocybe cubensis TaxID=181762 RepID=A0A8H8CIW4_PSICU|nr:hypothetical protein JR316_0008953 [Psilocybe cubensis]KAH9478498.1 hypothetical protein JR316_0008953 [Psilocybe cubensis]
MPPTQTPHRTPLRRVSQGSLFRLSRSNAFPDAPHGLGFLEPALAEFLDESETLQSNVEGMKHLSEALTMFNESFASWLYVMDMNALTTDWPQLPTDASFTFAKRRAEQDAIAAMEAIAAQTAAAKAREQHISSSVAAADKTMATDADMTFAGNATGASSNATKSGVPVPVKKKGAKAKLTAKEKKERSLEIERVVASLPLEFRGSDPSLRRNMEDVIEGIMYCPTQTVKLLDLIRPPDLNQARVNKCLIALVNRKVVQKENSTGTSRQIAENDNTTSYGRDAPPPRTYCTIANPATIFSERRARSSTLPVLVALRCIAAPDVLVALAVALSGVAPLRAFNNWEPGGTRSPAVSLPAPTPSGTAAEAARRAAPGPRARLAVLVAPRVEVAAVLQARRHALVACLRGLERTREFGGAQAERAGDAADAGCNVANTLLYSANTVLDAGFDARLDSLDVTAAAELC